MTLTMDEQIRRELDDVKRRLECLERRDPEGELTEVTKRALARARAAPASSRVSHDDVARELGFKTS
jgi:hypothetical protein